MSTSDPAVGPGSSESARHMAWHRRFIRILVQLLEIERVKATAEIIGAIAAFLSAIVAVISAIVSHYQKQAAVEAANAAQEQLKATLEQTEQFRSMARSAEGQLAQIIKRTDLQKRQLDILEEQNKYVKDPRVSIKWASLVPLKVGQNIRVEFETINQGGESPYGVKVLGGVWVQDRTSETPNILYPACEISSGKTYSQIPQFITSYSANPLSDKEYGDYARDKLWIVAWSKLCFKNSAGDQIYARHCVAFRSSRDKGDTCEETEDNTRVAK